MRLIIGIEAPTERILSHRIFPENCEILSLQADEILPDVGGHQHGIDSPADFLTVCSLDHYSRLGFRG